MHLRNNHARNERVLAKKARNYIGYSHVLSPSYVAVRYAVRETWQELPVLPFATLSILYRRRRTTLEIRELRNRRLGKSKPWRCRDPAKSCVLYLSCLPPSSCLLHESSLPGLSFSFASISTSSVCSARKGALACTPPLLCRYARRKGWLLGLSKDCIKYDQG